MDFEKNVVKKGKEEVKKQPKIFRRSNEGYRGGSPDRISALTGLQVGSEGAKGQRKGTKSMKKRETPRKYKSQKTQVLSLQDYLKNKTNGIQTSTTGKMVGRNVDHSKWRCNTCKFLNNVSESQCSRCHDPKQVYKDKSIFGGANAKKRLAERKSGIKPKKKAKIEEEKQPGLKPESSNTGGFQANIKTVGGLKYDTTSRYGEQKVGRIDNTMTTMEKLKKIADNSDKLDRKTCMEKAKDRRFVEELRDPAMFNMMTFDREYGGMPK